MSSRWGQRNNVALGYKKRAHFGNENRGEVGKGSELTNEDLLFVLLCFLQYLALPSVIVIVDQQ